MWFEMLLKIVQTRCTANVSRKCVIVMYLQNRTNEHCNIECCTVRIVFDFHKTLLSVSTEYATVVHSIL